MNRGLALPFLHLPTSPYPALMHQIKSFDVSYQWQFIHVCVDLHMQIILRDCSIWSFRYYFSTSNIVLPTALFVAFLSLDKQCCTWSI